MDDLGIVTAHLPVPGGVECWEKLLSLLHTGVTDASGFLVWEAGEEELPGCSLVQFLSTRSQTEKQSLLAPACFTQCPSPRMNGMTRAATASHACPKPGSLSLGNGQGTVERERLQAEHLHCSLSQKHF